MQQKIVFRSKSLNCSAIFYLPDNLSTKEKYPAIVMAYGIGSTKEMCLPQFAERFAAEGFAVLLFDYRNLGESEGIPRGQVFPEDQQEDYRNAITWIQQQPQIDPERIGAWGSSYSGGHVLHLSAFDRRIKCVVAQVPVVSGYLGSVIVYHDLYRGRISCAHGSRVLGRRGILPDLRSTSSAQPS
jgi:uncharacterized protein